MQAQRKPCVWRFLLVRLAASLAALASELPAANVVHGVCNVLPVSLQLESARELNGCSGSSPPDSPQPTFGLSKTTQNASVNWRTLLSSRSFSATGLPSRCTSTIAGFSWGLRKGPI